MEITFKGEKISIERGLAGISLTPEFEGPNELFRSIEAVDAAGYDRLEMRISMIISFLDAGHTGLLLTTDAMIAEIPEKKAAPAGGPDMGGGMY